jgi:molecular chaperone GrpE
VDKDKMKNNTNNDDADQSVDLQEQDNQESPQDQSELSLDDQLVKSKEEASKNWDKVLRLQAEIENLRKRTFRDIENASRGSIERDIMEILPILDSFELGLNLKTETIQEYKTFKEGQEASMMLMKSLFTKLSIETIDPSEMRYDPELHGVISTQNDDSVEPGYVIQVIQKGYRLKERLLRPARVIVSAEKNKDQPST